MSHFQAVQRLHGCLILAFVSLLNAGDESAGVIPGLDFWSGRVVPGIGFGFTQNFDEKISGDQSFHSTPYLYAGRRPDFSVLVSNETSVRNVGPTEDIRYNSNPVGNRTAVQLQWRPAATFQIFPYFISFSTRDTYDSYYSGDRHEEVDTGDRRLGFRGWFISKKGRLDADPLRLKWMNPIDSSLILPDPKQWIIQTSLDVQNFKQENQAWDLNTGQNPPFPLSDEERHDQTVSMTANYGFTGRLWAQVNLAHSDKKSTAESREFGMIMISRSGSRTWDAKAALIHQMKPALLHRLMLGLSGSNLQLDQQAKSENPEYPQFFSSSSSIDFQEMSFRYRAYWLRHVNAPGTDAFLANYQGIFGHRLNRRGICISPEAACIQEVLNPSQGELLNLHPYDDRIEVTLRRLQAGMLLRTGLTDKVEIQAETGYRAEQISQPDPLYGSALTQYFRNRLWSNRVGLRFGSKLYSPVLASQYGWFNSSPFDQLYGAMPVPGMIHVSMDIVHISYRHTDEAFSSLGTNSRVRPYASLLPAYINNMQGSFDLNTSIGMPGSIMLSGRGTRTFYESDRRNPGESDWYFSLSLDWQAWRTLRFSVRQISRRWARNIYTYPAQPPYDTYLTDMQTRHAWMFEVAGLW